MIRIEREVLLQLAEVFASASSNDSIARVIDVYDTLRQTTGASTDDSSSLLELVEALVSNLLEMQLGVDEVRAGATVTSSALATEQRRLKSLLDTAPCGIIAFDRNKSVIFANDAALRLRRRFTPDWTEDDPSASIGIVDQEDHALPRWSAALDESAETGRSVHGRLTGVELPDGRTSWIRASSSPLRDEHGQLSGAVATFDDVTEQVELQTTMAQSADLLRASERVSGIGSWELDEDSRVIAWSDGVYRLIGLTLGETLDPDAYSRHVHPDDRDRVFAAVAQGISTRSAVSIRHRLIRQDGTPLVVALMGEPPDDATLRTKLIGTVRDITAEVDEQHRLQRVQQLDSIGRLAGGIAHDLNNLLTVLSGHSEILSDIVTGAGRDNIAAIRRATDSAATLTRQLLDVGRRQVLQPTGIDINSMVESHRATCRRLLPDAVTFTIELADDLPMVMMDAGKLDQVMLNVMLNAADAVGASGSVIIRTALITVTDEATQRTLHDPVLLAGQHVCVSINDDGAGIPPDVLERVFEPFFTTKPHGQGTGLGLSTSYGIMQQSGGHLALSSQVGVGTTVQIYLPATDEAPRATAESTTAHRVAASPQCANVLVVEDTAAVRELTVAALEQSGYRVFAAVDGINGVAVAAACPEHLDLLITDVSMPGFGGHELATALTTTRPGIRVLYMSGYTEDSVVLQGIAQAGINFLAKPFTVSELIAKVVEVLADQPAG